MAARSPSSRGRLIDSGEEAALFPGDLPEDPAAILAPARQGADDWTDAAYRVTRFAPPRRARRRREACRTSASTAPRSS